MARKSDTHRPPALRAARRVSATQASRAFSRILDVVESGGEILVRRRGRDVCVMALPTGLPRRASACLAALRGRAPVRLDGRFGMDLRAVLAAERVEEPPAWGS